MLRRRLRSVFGCSRTSAANWTHSFRIFTALCPRRWLEVRALLVQGSPRFSALWAIANQQASAPLGKAVQYLYSLPKGAVTDIVPVGSRHNVTASIQEASGTNRYSPSQVLGGATPTDFVSGLWDHGYDPADVVWFGTDCQTSSDNAGTSCNRPSALPTNVGWDNMTGVGTPNGQSFADFFQSPTGIVK
jgi:hypothetical protein